MPLIRKEPPATALPSPATAAQLKSGTAEERWSAARRLERSPAHVAALREALEDETDAQVREALFTALAQIHTPEAVEAVLPFLRSDNAAIRTGALDALNAMPGAAEAYIPQLLEDADPDVRLLICDTVRKLPNPMATSCLCALLQREKEKNVAAAAIEALSEVGDAQALPVLEECARRFADEPFLLFSIRLASQRIGGDDHGQPQGPRVP